MWNLGETVEGKGDRLSNKRRSPVIGRFFDLHRRRSSAMFSKNWDGRVVAYLQTISMRP